MDNALNAGTAVESVPNLKGVAVCVFTPNRVVEFALLLEKSPLSTNEDDVLFTVVAVPTTEPFGADDIGFSLDAISDVCIVFTVPD